MRRLVSLLAWLAQLSRANIRAAGRRSSHAGYPAVPGVAVLGQTIGPDRAGRFVPMPDDTIETGRSLFAHWALWAAVALIVLILAAGYVRRRWKAGWRPRPQWHAWGRNHEGK